MEKWKNLPLVSATLVIINVAVFIICTFTGDWLYNMGGLNLWGILVEHEYGRIFWALFLHADESHIFNNMIILFFLGAMIEKEIGHIRYALFYFLSGIAGNILSLISKYMAHDLSMSIGASGAVFGLDGVLLALVLFSGRKMENVTWSRVVIMIVYSLYSGFTGQNIDNAAHVGGLVMGFLLGLGMCILERLQTKRKGKESNFEY